MRAKESQASGFGVLVLCGFALAGLLTFSLALSLRAGDVLRTLLNAGLLWVAVTLITRNLDNLATAEGRSKRGAAGAAGRKAKGPVTRPGSKGP